MHACPPWKAPDPRWGAFPAGHESYEWCEQAHAEIIEKIFERGRNEQRAAEHRRNKVAKMQKQATPEQKKVFTERMKNHTFSGSRW